jgi:hypothetical protein
MNSGDVDAQREELLSYREDVLRELERRVSRVREFDAQIAATQYALDSSDRDRKVLTGQAVRVLAQVSYRARLKKQLEAQQRDREEALEDLRRAEARLVDVDDELSQLDELSEVEALDAGERGEN